MICDRVSGMVNLFKINQSELLAFLLFLNFGPRLFCLNATNFQSIIFYNLPGFSSFLVDFSYLYFNKILFNQLASWSSCNAFVSRARDLKFKSRAGQNKYGAPQTRYSLRRNTASLIKNLTLQKKDKARATIVMCWLRDTKI